MYLFDNSVFKSQILKDGLDDDVHFLELVIVGGGDEAWHELLSVDAAHLLALNLLVNASLNLKVTIYKLKGTSYKLRDTSWKFTIYYH